jgi:hypothetical protein
VNKSGDLLRQARRMALVARTIRVRETLLAYVYSFLIESARLFPVFGVRRHDGGGTKPLGVH